MPPIGISKNSAEKGKLLANVSFRGTRNVTHSCEVKADRGDIPAVRLQDFKRIILRCDVVALAYQVMGGLS